MRSIFLCLIILIAGVSFSHGADDQIKEAASNDGLTESGQGVVLHNLYSIHEINQKKFSFGTYHTEGYVVKKYECPICPQGAMCKPCMGNNIVISEDEKRIEPYNITVNDLIIFVDDVSVFELGKKYRFLIQILDAKTTSQFINNVKLVYFEVPEGL